MKSLHKPSFRPHELEFRIQDYKMVHLLKRVSRIFDKSKRLYNSTLTSVHDFRLDLLVPFFGFGSKVESSAVEIDS